MRAHNTRILTRVHTLVAHGISTAVEETEVVAIAVKGRHRGGQASRKSDEVGKHDVFGAGVLYVKI